MSTENGGDGRPNPFSALDRFKVKDDTASVLSVDIDKLADDNSFPSREPQPAKQLKRRRFGDVEAPTEQLNFRAKVAAKERFYVLADQYGYRKLGDFFEKMLDAFEEQQKQ